MKTYLFKKTQTIKTLFLAIGYSLMAICIVQIGLLVYGNLVPTSLLHTVGEDIKVMAWSATVVKTAAIMLFCFLMRSVLEIMSDRDTEKLANASILAKLSVNCFLLSATLTIFGSLWSWSQSEFMGVNTLLAAFSSGDGILIFLKSFLRFMGEGLKDIVIALSITTLFDHFRESIIFESEVA